MTGKILPILALSVLVLTVGCAPKRVPAAKQNLFVLLPEPDGNASGIIVKNAAGSQTVNQPYQAIRVERSDVAPSQPFPLDQAEVQRLFGSALDSLPAAEVQFLVYFEEGKDVLTAESEAQFPAILNAIRERHSTAITVTGHTDTTGDSPANYRLGLARAQRVAMMLKAQGVNDSDLFVSSHGDGDLLVQTGRGVAEARNRRVEIIVR